MTYDVLNHLLSLVDLTTLEGSDTRDKLKLLAEKSRSLPSIIPGLSTPAAICVYPRLAETVAESLQGTTIRTAVVAGGFPSGQTSLAVKLDEIKFAIRSGASEIDYVFSRGLFLEGQHQQISDELEAVRQTCGNTICLKIILETGELVRPELIRKASVIAIKAGADFIKTSTGKSSVSATPEAVKIMAECIRDHFVKTGKKIGLKPSGGIADEETALQYIRITENILGKDWITPSTFRLGASRLVNSILNKIADCTSQKRLESYF
jgi:deoxyribose-phosphate aldolase